MRRVTKFGPTFLVIAVVALLAAGAAAGAQYSEPTLTAQVEGDVAVVSGSGCAPDETVQWSLHAGGNANGAAELTGSTTADANGEFGFSIELGDRRGRYTVRTQCGDLIQEASFTVAGGGNGGGPPADAGPPAEAGQRASSETSVTGLRVLAAVAVLALLVTFRRRRSPHPR